MTYPRPALSVLGLALAMLLLAARGTPQPTPVPTPSRTAGPTPTPLPLRARGWHDLTVRTLCLEVEQSFSDTEGRGLEPIAEATQEILGRLGVQVLTGRAACDGALTITMVMEARGSVYFGQSGSRTCYTGSSASGEMLLTASDHPPASMAISGFHPNPSEIGGCPTPADAPLEASWRQALVKGFAGFWGPQVLIQALDDEYHEVRQVAAQELGKVRPREGVVSGLVEALDDPSVAAAAATSLGQIGPGAAAAVPALCQSLEHRQRLVRSSAARALCEIGPEAMEAVPDLIQALGDREISSGACEALRAITGQSLGEDAAAWQHRRQEQQ